MTQPEQEAREMLTEKAGMTAMAEWDRHGITPVIVDAMTSFAARPTAGIDREVEGCLLESVREAGEEYAENGFWVTCSGCYESEFGNGQGVGDSPAVKAFGCNLGCGCSECGGIGAIWDTTDYDAMAREMLADELLPTPAKTGERGAVIEECDAPARVR